jgi:hypothetical protein
MKPLRLLAPVTALTMLTLALTPGNTSAATKVAYESATAAASPSQELFPYTAATASRGKYLAVWGNGWSAAAAQWAAQTNCLNDNPNPIGNDCKTGAWVLNGYVAIAWSSDSRSWGSGWGHTQKRAKEEATKSCTNFAGEKCTGHVYSYASRSYDPGKETTGGGW